MNLFSKTALAIILLIYLLFGLSHSSNQGFWHDEIYTLTFLKGVSVYDFNENLWSSPDGIYDVSYFKRLLSEDNYYNNFSTQILHEGHPPLYFILLKFWTQIFGCTEVALRSFSLCCGLLVFLILFSLFKRKSKKVDTAWFLLSILIFNPFLFYYFTEARMYALAMLFATLSFKYWIEYQENRKIRTSAFLYFCLSSIGLLYTHYYGLFFLSSLAIFELIKFGMRRTIFNHSIALFCFLPWFVVIKKQLSFHDVHWTDGIISIIESSKGYLNGIIELSISPLTAPLLYEKLIFFFIILLTLSLLLRKESKFTLILVIVAFFYGLQVYLFDQIVGHHSILVSRYYMFILLFLYWGLYKMFDNSHRIYTIMVTVAYLSVTSIVLVQMYKLERSPKQMFREVAGYLDSQSDVKNSVLVFEPKGPLMVGVAYYLQNNFKMVLATEFEKTKEFKSVYIDEMLGVSYRENKFHREEQSRLNFVPFVGVFLYK